MQLRLQPANRLAPVSEIGDDLLQPTRLGSKAPFEVGQFKPCAPQSAETKLRAPTYMSRAIDPRLSPVARRTNIRRRHTQQPLGVAQDPSGCNGQQSFVGVGQPAEDATSGQPQARHAGCMVTSFSQGRFTVGRAYAPARAPRTPGGPRADGYQRGLPTARRGAEAVGADQVGTYAQSIPRSRRARGRQDNVRGSSQSSKGEQGRQ